MSHVLCRLAGPALQLYFSDGEVCEEGWLEVAGLVALLIRAKESLFCRVCPVCSLGMRAPLFCPFSCLARLAVRFARLVGSWAILGLSVRSCRFCTVCSIGLLTVRAVRAYGLCRLCGLYRLGDLCSLSMLCLLCQMCQLCRHCGLSELRSLR